MATNAVKGANVTKFDAPGGDNIIADGYINTVEKVWLDNYTLTSVITLTNTTISLATLPPNKKLTRVCVMIETSASQTDQTVALGWSTDADASGFGNIVNASVITHNLTVTTLNFPPTGSPIAVVSTAQLPGKMSAFQEVTSGTKVTIALKLNNWTATTGTIKSLVAWT